MVIFLIFQSGATSCIELFDGSWHDDNKVPIKRKLAPRYAVAVVNHGIKKEVVERGRVLSEHLNGEVVAWPMALFPAAMSMIYKSEFAA
jgi:hypothetical protein